MKRESNTFCPHAWNHFSVRADGHIRLCCNVSDGNSNLIRDNNGNFVKIDQIQNLLDFYNLDHYKRIRKNMVSGIKNEECNLCYSLESSGATSFRNTAVEKFPYHIFSNNTNENTGEINFVEIKYLDLAWGNKCNLQCKMCSPFASDQLIQEFEKFYGSVEKFSLESKSYWNYKNINVVLETISTNGLTEILVTGGEPLINNDFYQFCEFLIKSNLSKNITLSFHTNLTVNPKKWESIFSKFFRVYYKVSLDAIEKSYEYIRYPGKWKIINENIDSLVSLSLNNPKIYIEIHTVFSFFNAHAIVDLLNYCTSKKNYNDRIKFFPQFNFVFGPQNASPFNFPHEEKLKIKELIENFIVNYDFSEMPENLKSHIFEKINVLRSCIDTMFIQQTSIENLIDNINQIKKIDEYRGQNTYDYMPWIKQYNL